VEQQVRQHHTCVMQPRNLIHVPRNIKHHFAGSTVKEIRCLQKSRAQMIKNGLSKRKKKYNSSNFEASMLILFLNWQKYPFTTKYCFQNNTDTQWKILIPPMQECFSQGQCQKWLTYEDDLERKMTWWWPPMKYDL
jgi:hypothetical protein